MDKALQKIGYGLYLISTNHNGKDNACIINTAFQCAKEMIAVSVTKTHHTCKLLLERGEFNLSVLSKEVDFDLIKRFGFQTGADVDKFEGFEGAVRAENGILRLNKRACAYFSARVLYRLDLDSHYLFVARLEKGEVLNDESPCTYSYYHSDIKPKPKAEAGKSVWVCRVCGYTHNGEEPPEVCPLCKVGKENFNKM